MPKHYYQIGEVANMLSVQKHTLRYWETEFPTLSPRKNRGGKRVYTLEDIDLLKQIKYLLYEQNFSIEGARKKIASGVKEAQQIEIPLYDIPKAEIRKKLINRVAKIQDIIELPADHSKTEKKELIKTKINRIFDLLNSPLT